MMPLNDELIDLGYPRLPGTYKTVNGTIAILKIVDSNTVINLIQYPLAQK